MYQLIHFFQLLCSVWIACRCFVLWSVAAPVLRYEQSSALLLKHCSCLALVKDLFLLFCSAALCRIDFFINTLWSYAACAPDLLPVLFFIESENSVFSFFYLWSAPLQVSSAAALNDKNAACFVCVACNSDSVTQYPFCMQRAKQVLGSSTHSVRTSIKITLSRVASGLFFCLFAHEKLMWYNINWNDFFISIPIEKAAVIHPLRWLFLSLDCFLIWYNINFISYAVSYHC